MSEKIWQEIAKAISQVCGTLFLIFLVLKLAGLVAWSWWGVTAPLWAPTTPLVLYIIFLAWLREYRATE